MLWQWEWRRAIAYTIFMSVVVLYLRSLGMWLMPPLVLRAEASTAYGVDAVVDMVETVCLYKVDGRRRVKILPQILGSQRLENISGRRARTTSWDLELI